MGIEINAAKFLAYARQLGVNYDRTAMLGRQCLFLSKRQLSKALTSVGQSLTVDEAEQMIFSDQRFAESFFRRLGATDIESFDNSNYENATHIFDINRPVPDVFKESYTAVFDGGTLEHVFNFPVAIKNCMEMVKIGGHFLASMPANNFFGHGFYQFSPEVLYRIFSEANGFRVVNMIAAEDFVRPKWYAVKDPDEVGRRVVLVNRRPVYLMVLAERLERTDIFSDPPMQSDYSARWEKIAQRNAGNGDSSPSVLKRVKDQLPLSFRFAMLRYLQSRQYGFKKQDFVAFDPAKGDLYPLEGNRHRH